MPRKGSSPGFESRRGSFNLRLSLPGAGSTTLAPPVTWLNPLSIALPPALFRRGPSTALPWRASRRAGLRPSLGGRPSSCRSPTAVRLAALDGRRPARGPCSCALVGCAAGHSSRERARGLSLGLSLEPGRQGRPRQVLSRKSPTPRAPTAARQPSARHPARRPPAQRDLTVVAPRRPPRPHRGRAVRPASRGGHQPKRS